MMSKQELPIQKKVYEKNSFSNVINRKFRQLITQEEQNNEIPQPTIEEFFQIYEDLFFDIPKEGETNSHRYLVEKSSEYLELKNENSIDIRLLQEEITSLREQLLEANQILSDIKLDK